MEMLGKVKRLYLRGKLSLHEIAKTTGLSRNTIRKWVRDAGVSRPTAVRLVESLRELGCTIASERAGHDYWYRLDDWGVFSPARVRQYVKNLGQTAPTGSAP